jgi:hypothetical protein
MYSSPRFWVQTNKKAFIRPLWWQKWSEKLNSDGLPDWSCLGLRLRLRTCRRMYMNVWRSKFQTCPHALHTLYMCHTYIHMCSCGGPRCKIPNLRSCTTYMIHVSYIHTYIHTYIQTYIHYIHTYICTVAEGHAAKFQTCAHALHT